MHRLNGRIVGRTGMTEADIQAEFSCYLQPDREHDPLHGWWLGMMLKQEQRGEHPKGCKPAGRCTGRIQGSSKSRGWWFANGEQESCPAPPGMVLICLINATPNRK